MKASLFAQNLACEICKEKGKKQVGQSCHLDEPPTYTGLPEKTIFRQFLPFLTPPPVCQKDKVVQLVFGPFPLNL